MAKLIKRQITVRRAGKTFRRSVMVRSDASKSVVRQYRGTAIRHGLLSGIGAGIGGYAAHAAGRNLIHGTVAGGVVTSLGVLNTASAKRLSRALAKDARRGGRASVDVETYRGAGMVVGGMVGAAGARLAHGLYDHFKRRR